MQAWTWIAVAVAGAAGALSRFAATQGLKEWLGEGPWPVAAVNVLGCFGFGVCSGLLQGRVPQAVYLGVVAGFFGAFTTFSAFAHDGVQLLEARRFLAFAGNVALQNALGLVALCAGLAVTARA